MSLMVYRFVVKLYKFATSTEHPIVKLDTLK